MVQRIAALRFGTYVTASVPLQFVRNAREGFLSQVVKSARDPVIVPFVLREARHMRASAHPESTAGFRAASAVILWAFSPAPDATPVRRTADHHSAGIESRCHHLLTADALHSSLATSDTSAAIASRDDHSSITDRKDGKSPMDGALGQIVLNGKANLSYDCGEALGQNCPMAKDPGKSLYVEDFVARVRWARKARYETQDAIAKLMNMPQDSYKHFEAKRIMPHELIGRFCMACGVDANWLVTGQGKAPARSQTEVDPPQTRRAPKSKARAA
jgi:hypothetical protein